MPLPDGLPEVDINAVRAAQIAVRDAVRAGILASAHDIAEGGLAVALAECCLAGRLGAEIELLDAPPEPATVAARDREALPGVQPQVILFGESPGGFLVSGEETSLGELAAGGPVRRIGTVGGEVLTIAIPGERLTITLSELAQAHARLEELF
jgi:phosphoribosylformylglycinamidine synthase